MSVTNWTQYNGKVVSNIYYVTESSPGGKTEYSVSILLDGTYELKLKSQSPITIEENLNLRVVGDWKNDQ